MLELAKVVGVIGNTKAMVIYIFIFCTVLFVYNKRKEALTTFFSFSTAAGLTFLLKHIFKIPRPESMLIMEGGYRFPSGHATSAGVVFGLSIFFAYKFFPSKKQRFKRMLILSLGFAWLVLSMYSRVYLQVHLWIDVFLGAFFGLFLTAIIAHLFTKHFSYKRGTDLM